MNILKSILLCLIMAIVFMACNTEPSVSVFETPSPEPPNPPKPVPIYPADPEYWMLTESEGYAFNPSWLSNDVGYSEYGFIYPWDGGSVYDNGILLISSKKDVDELFGEVYSFSYVEGQGFIPNDNFQNVISKYDEEFFETRQIITFVIARGSPAQLWELENLTYQNGILTVGLNYLNRPIGAPGVVVYDFVILETYKVPVDAAIEIEMLNKRNADENYKEWEFNENYYKL